MPESEFESLKLDVCLAAEQWLMHRAGRGMPHTKSLFEAEEVLDAAATKWLDLKISMIQKHIADARAASPDGMDSWDRVEKYRLEHGHLPAQDGSKQPGCKVCEAIPSPPKHDDKVKP